MATGLANRSHDVEVLTLNESENDVPPGKPYSIRPVSDRWLRTQFARGIQSARVLERFEETTDIFHIFNPTLLPGGGLYRLRGGTVPVVGRLNTYNMFCPNTAAMDGTCHKRCTARAKFAHDDAGFAKRLVKLPFYASETYLEPRVANGIDRFFAISPAVKEVYSHVGLKPDEISVVPNFVDSSFETEQAAPDSNAPLSLVTIGRLKELKGIDVIIDAIATASTSVELTVVGDGPQRDSLEARAKAVGVEDEVTFTGWVPYEEIASYYAAADVYVHASLLPEPFGRTVLEALQCGLPGLVSDIGGPPWIVGNAGISFARGDAQALASILEELGTGQRDIEMLASHCASQVARFDRDKVLDQIESEYREVVGNGLALS